jgi:hypothetical protein
MSIRHWLVASVAANVVLAAFVAFRSPDVAQTRTESAISMRESSVPAGPRPDPASLDPTQQKILALAELEAEVRSAPPRVEFWTAAQDSSLDSSLQRVEWENDSIRQALKEKFGEDAEHDPLFARLFRPLDSRYPYLSSRSQLALSKLQRSRTAESVARIRPEGSTNAAPGPVRDPLNEGLRKVLSPAELEAYELRESPLARQLRASGVTASEGEFRAAFQILNRADPSQGPAAYLGAQRDLEKLLGQERAVQFSASRDPAFQTVRETASAQSVNDAQALKVYDAIKAAQLNSLEAQSSAGGDRALAAQKIRDIMSRRDAQIASLVGESAAKEILMAYSNKLMSMSRRNDVGAL